MPRAALWALGGLFLLAILLSWLDDSTELIPDHDGLKLLGMLAALAVGAACIPTGWRLSRGSRLPSRVVFALAAACVGLAPAIFAFSSAIDLLTGMSDFPSAQTRSFQALLPIASARYHQQKGGSASIQAMAGGEAIGIEKEDYVFMAAHRPAASAATRPFDMRDNDEMSDKGWFCARITVQQAGSALRVLHAGKSTLPAGSIVVCPTGNASSLPFVTRAGVVAEYVPVGAN